MQQGLDIAVNGVAGKGVFHGGRLMEGYQLVAEAMFLGYTGKVWGGIIVIQCSQPHMTAGEIFLHHQFHGEAGDNMVGAPGKGQALVVAGHGRQQVNLTAV